jgi:predicted O-linked N-acetylglucosamine transferase (SPINDLY family)
MQKLSFPQKKTAKAAWEEALNLFSQNKIQEGLALFHETIQIDPHYEEAFLGTLQKLLDLNHLGIAEGIAHMAHARFPNSLKIKYICAHFFDKVKNMENVLKILTEAWHLSHENFEITTQLIGSSESLCEWGMLQDVTKRILSEYEKENFYQTREFPLFHVAWCDDLKINQRVISKHAMDFCGHIKPFASKKINQKARIRIGYLSSDWYDHATLILMQGMFKNHNRDQFEIYIYDHSPVLSNPSRAILKQNTDAWYHLHTLSDEDAAQKIREDDVDILIEVKAWTQGHRTQILAYKPVPLQVSFLALPATTGAPFIDYIIGDPTVTPKEHDRYYTEKVIRLPDTYQPNDCDRAISFTGKTREDFGLRDDQFVFCSFNQTFKIDPVIFSAWMEILKKIPNSVLWLLKPADQKAQDNLTKFAKWMHGIDQDRLIFSNRLPNSQHLERLRLADIALDTRIYTGHTTTADALWCNVPVVTIEGKHFASRVAAGLLKAINVVDTIAYSVEEFIEKACFLAHNKDSLKDLKLKIEKNRLIAPLFDTKRYVLHFESGLKTIYERHANDLSPQSFDVEAMPQRSKDFDSSPMNESYVSVFNLVPSLEKVIGPSQAFSKNIKVKNKTAAPLFFLGEKQPLGCEEIKTFGDVLDLYFDQKAVGYIRPCLDEGVLELYKTTPKTIPDLKPFSFIPKLSADKVQNSKFDLFYESSSPALDMQTEKFLRFLLETVMTEEKIDPHHFFNIRQQSFDRFLKATKKENTIPFIIHRVWLNLSNQYYEIPDLSPLLTNIQKDFHNYLWVNNTALCSKSVDILEKAGYEIKFFPRDLPQASTDLFNDQFFKEKNMGTAVDILKTEILYHIGGVYLDTDVEICDDLKSWCEKAHFLTTVAPNLVLHNGFFMASAPKHPVIKKLRDLIARNLSPKTPSYFQNQYPITDPRVKTAFSTEALPLSIACALSLNPLHDFVLPPYLFHKMAPSFFPLAIHFHQEMWLKIQSQQPK